MTTRRARSRAISIGLLLGLLGPVGIASEVRGDDSPIGGAVTESVAHGDMCGDEDLPEEREDGQLQGDVPQAHRAPGADGGPSRAEQGYNCGLALVGRTELDADGRDTSNANMAWVDDCAYVAGSAAPFGPAKPADRHGVAVVDVSDPENPDHVMTLKGRPGSTSVLETIHAVETPERSVLVVGVYGNQSGGNKPMDIYDVSDCANPVHLAEYTWSENIHNLTISGNGQYVFATQPLQVIDIGPLFEPGRPDNLVCDETRLTPHCPISHGNLESAIPAPPVTPGPLADLDDPVEDVAWSQTNSRYTSHEAWPTDDGTKLYLGSQLPAWEQFMIVDITDWLAGDGPPEVISQRTGRGHSVRTATVEDEEGKRRRYVLHSEESVIAAPYGCVPETLNPFAGAAQPWLTDITNESNPVPVSQFGLAINEPANCAAQADSDVNASVHYHDVDDEADTSFAIVSMMNAGLRVFDLRDPETPTEVAYFNPGDVDRRPDAVTLDQAWGHVRYVAETGHIWVATQAGGFWVLEIEPQVREHLGLDERDKKDKKPKTDRPDVRHPNGRAGTRGVEISAASLPLLGSDAWYCTLSPVQATVPTVPTAPTSPLPALTG